MNEINPQYSNFNDLPFDGDQRLITIRLIYRINDDIVEILNIFLIIGVYTNQM